MVDYQANVRAWVTSHEFRDWIIKFDMELKSQNRKLLLLLDNAPCHKKIPTWNIDFQFLPKNSTDVLQPLDAGIIKTFKTHYRKYQLERIIEIMDEDNASTQVNQRITLKDALYFIKKAWNDVSSQTIQNCWKHTGLIQTGDNIVEIPDENMQDIKFIGNAISKLHVENNCSVDEYINMDADFEIFKELDDNEIVDVVTHEQKNESAENISNNFEIPNKKTPTLKNAIDSAGVIKRFLLETPGIKEETLESFLRVDREINRLKSLNGVQSTLTEYFNKK